MSDPAQVYCVSVFHYSISNRGLKVRAERLESVVLVRVPFSRSNHPIPGQLCDRIVEVTKVRRILRTQKKPRAVEYHKFQEIPTRHSSFHPFILPFTITTMTSLSIESKNALGMPMIGFGTYQMKPDQAEASVMEAIKVGFRHIDSAEGYHNERGHWQSLEGLW
mmetsp:Transcript_26510/g.64610  ORF Transcript_26510/g.64610 Transcript_26510/m.64610 type:complete len:164 (+) Transcript_26510:695-1186(+)